MLEVKSLQTNIYTDNGVVRAVDGVSLKVSRGETIGIVGESGSGKSMLAHSIMRLNPETQVEYESGEILFQGKDILKMSEKALRTMRGNDIAMVFQDPMSGLNPLFTIGRQLIEAIRKTEKISKQAAQKRAIELLNDVGIPQAEERLKDYPHQFSGGMRQRVLIAIALSRNPKLLIADEPTTALDVTVQASILKLLKKLQKKYEMAIIIISHDLGVIAQMADRVYVMYCGRIVEEGSVEQIFYQTQMPYTWSLLRAQPHVNKEVKLQHIKGQPPNMIERPIGCHFHPRCPFKTEQCEKTDPSLRKVNKNHYAACILTELQFKEKEAHLKEGV